VPHHHFNGLKTALLLGGLSAAVVVVGGFFGRGGLVIAVMLALAMNAYGYWNSDKLALRAMRAYPVTEAPQPGMYRIVRELSQRAGQPMPSLFVSPTRSPNAFATGRNPQHAAVCCTEGILALLDERELRGVLGHELMHVYNRDILTASIAGALASAVTFLAQFGLFFGGGDEERANPVAAIGLMILGPLAAGIVQMAISRTREYDADEDGSRLTGDPLALASALAKLEGGVTRYPLAPERSVVNASHMRIANPFRGAAVLDPPADRAPDRPAGGHGRLSPLTPDPGPPDP
jgi:heat shock protein HtpX